MSTHLLLNETPIIKLELLKKRKKNKLTSIRNLKIDSSTSLDRDFAWNSIQINNGRTLTYNQQR